MFNATFMPAPRELIVPGTYSLPLVALSISVAVLGACTSLQIVHRMRGERSRWVRMVGLCSGSLALGSGVWAMHFIGMLSFQLCAAVTYDPAATLASMLPSLAASSIALAVLARPKIGLRDVFLGGVLMGGGIGAMHYSGMAAMRMAPSLRYDPVMFGVSIIIAVMLAMIAIGVREGIRRYRPKLSGAVATLASGTIMGLAVAGMHYTGMAASRFVGLLEVSGGQSPARFGPSFLALAVAAITAIVALLAMGTNWLVLYRAMVSQLRASEARMRAVSEVAFDGIVIVDGATIIREINPAAERIFSCTSEEVVGKPASLLMPTACKIMHQPSDGPMDYPVRQIDGGVVLEIDSQRLDGRTFPSRLAIGQTQLQEQGLCVIFVSDMTEINRAANAMRLGELKFRALIGNLPGIAYRLSTEGEHTIEFLSEGVTAVTGYSPEDFVGREGVLRWRAMTHEEDRHRADRQRMEAMNEGRRFEFEYRIRHRSGEWRWVWEAASSIRNADGKPIIVDGMIFDVTERRAIEDALREAKSAAERALAAKSSFVANMSHEIRTPLNAVLGFAQVGLKRYGGQPVEATFRRILSSGELLLGIVNDVLDFSKIEAGKITFESRPFDPTEVVDRSVALIAPQARAKGLDFVVHEAADLPRVCLGDALRLSQIVVNLLSNAAKFTERGEIGLAVRYEAGQLCFEVSDTGIGMTLEQQTRLFTAFEQGDGSITRRFGGTGLGLVISQRLVEAMGGTISCDSLVADGTHFHVAVPIQVEAGPRPWPRRSVALVGLPQKDAQSLKWALAERGSPANILTERDVLAHVADLVIVGAEAFARMLPDTVVTLHTHGARVGVVVGPGEEDALAVPQCVPMVFPIRARLVLEAAESNRTSPGELATLSGKPLAGLRVLVVEDNQVNQLVIADMLDLGGAESMLTNDGSDALERLRTAGTRAFDIVLTDIQMPVMDGYETTRRILEMDASLPIVGVTAHSLTEERARCIDAGMVDCVTKPVDVGTLTAVIAARSRRPVGPTLETAAAQTLLACSRAAATAATRPSDPLDWGAFEARFGNRPALLKKLPGTLLRSLDGMPDSLRAAAEGVDFEAIMSEGHKAKGMFGTLGFTQLAQLALECESAARGHDALASTRALELAKMLESVRNSAERYLAAHRQQAERVG